jgi:hypothetical protein
VLQPVGNGTFRIDQLASFTRIWIVKLGSLIVSIELVAKIAAR